MKESEQRSLSRRLRLGAKTIRRTPKGKLVDVKWSKKKWGTAPYRKACMLRLNLVISTKSVLRALRAATAATAATAGKTT